MILTWFAPDPLPLTGFAGAEAGRSVVWFSAPRAAYTWLESDGAAVELVALPQRAYEWLGSVQGATQLLASVIDAGAVTGALPTFESVAQNLSAYPFFALRDGFGKISALIYTTPAGVITKSFAREGGKIARIVLSGDLPAGLGPTIKTFQRTGAGVWAGTAYCGLIGAGLWVDEAAWADEDLWVDG